jgi:hypothetical protein
MLNSEYIHATMMMTGKCNYLLNAAALSNYSFIVEACI